MNKPGSIKQILQKVLIILLLAGITSGASAQDCICPEILQVTVQGQSCNLTNSGACTVCDSILLTFSITQADKLPGGGAVRWYSDTDPDFDPTAGQGTLRHTHIIPNITCNLGNQVKINEFQPWPVNGDNNFADSTTGEWIEIIGPPGAYIGCYILTDGDWTVTIPAGTVLPADGLYVIGYGNYGPVDLDVGTCNCSNEGAPNEALVLDNQGEYLALWNGFSYVDAVRYGNPTLANNPPFGNLVTLGTIPTKGLLGCSSQIPISFPMFTQFNTLPQINHTYEREPDLSGPWKLEECGSRGRCNVDIDVGLPLSFSFLVPASTCGTTQYFKAIIDPIPNICTQGPNGIAAGPFAFTVNCPETIVNPLLCPGDSMIVNGQVYNQANPSGTEVMTGFFGCDSLIHVDLSFSPMASIQWMGDTTICRGDGFTLNGTFLGSGPFQYAFTANGIPIVSASTPNVFSMGLNPLDTTIYAVSSLIDGNGCPFQIADTYTVAVNQPLASFTIEDPLICLGDSTDLIFTLEGGAPFDISYFADAQLFSSQGSTGHRITINPGDTTIYSLISVTDHRGCSAILGGSDTLFVTDPLEINSLLITCSADMMTYTIEVGLENGIPGGYQINGAAGQWSGSTWTSNPLPSGSTYLLTVMDGGPCMGEVLTGNIDCNCTNDPGILEIQDTLQICPGETTHATFLSNPVLNPGDTLLYLLYTNPFNPLNSLLATGGSEIFSHQIGWPVNQVLWMSSAVSRIGPLGLDPSDPCMRVGDPLPLIFREYPEVQITVPPFICGDECMDFQITLSSLTSSQISILWGESSNPQTLDFTSTSNQHLLSLCGDVHSGDLFFQVVSASDTWCTAPAELVQLIPHLHPVLLDYSQMLCASDSLILHGQWYHSGRLTDTFILDFIGPMGCDTVVQVNLQHVPLSQGLLQRTLCEGTIINLGGQTFDQGNPSGQVLLPNAAHSGCDSLVLVDLTFTSYVVNQITQTLCVNDTIWVANQSFHIQNPTGTITLPGASELGCDSVIEVNLLFYPDLALTLSGGGIYCPGQQVSLTLNGTSSSYDLTLGTPGGPSFDFSGINPGQSIPFIPGMGGLYTLTSATANGIPCPVQMLGGADIQLENLSAEIQPTTSYHGSPISCAGEADGGLEIQVTGSPGPFQIEWQDGSNQSARSGLGTGIYAVTVTSPTGCTTSAVFDLVEPIVFSFEARATTRPCKEGAISVMSISGGNKPYSWSTNGLLWHPMPGPPFALIEPGAGTTLFRIRDANGCAADTSLVVPDGGPLVSLVAFPDTTIFLGQEVVLGFSSSVTPMSIIWSPPRYLNCPHCPEPIAKPVRTTEYELRITDEEGCEVVTYVTVNVLDDADFVYIPNAFSPNGDGVNDQFIPFADATQYQIVAGSIFDRWGNMLWEIQDSAPGDLNAGWNGKSGGLLLDNGLFVYYFTIRNLLTGAEKTYKGEILLMR